MEAGFNPGSLGFVVDKVVSWQICLQYSDLSLLILISSATYSFITVLEVCDRPQTAVRYHQHPSSFPASGPTHDEEIMYLLHCTVLYLRSGGDSLETDSSSGKTRSYEHVYLFLEATAGPSRGFQRNGNQNI